MEATGDKRPLPDADGGADALMGKKRLRKLKQQNPDVEAFMRYKSLIEVAAKEANGAAAVEAFDSLKAAAGAVNPFLHRVVINVCANDQNAPTLQEAAFKIYDDLVALSVDNASQKHRPDETVYSALIKICAKSKDFKKCLDLLNSMKEQNIEPRLRTFSTLLAAYGEADNVSKALWVKGQIVEYELEMTEADYVALLRVCTRTNSKPEFESILNEFCERVPTPGPDALSVLEDWFSSDVAEVDGRKWQRFEEEIDEHGVSSVTGETLQSIELPEDEVEALLEKVESLVTTDEKRIEQWAEFKAWLDEHGPFDVLLDAANIGYFNQNYAGGGFSYKQVQLMVEYYENQGKKVLVVLHKRRTYEDIVPTEYHALLQTWKDRNVMYNCRKGNNDDWYWLYAAVKFRGRTLVVSNDEMRDHHFQMIHTRSLAHWKERHQVHYSIQCEKYVEVHEPRAYSLRPQCLGTSWHFPRLNSSEWLGFQLEPSE